MIRHFFILLAILIACSGYSPGLHMSYPNKSIVYFSVRETITLTCTGHKEVMVTVDSPPKGIYSIKEETPCRKVVEIKNATVFNIGNYVCYSNKNRKEFVSIYLSPDASCFESLGYNFRGGSVMIPP